MTVSRLLAAFFAASASAALAAPTISGCPLLPADNIWNRRVDTLPVHPNSAAYIANIGATRSFHMDFGSGLYPDPPDPAAAPIGIPFVVVGGTQPKVPVVFDVADESNAGPYPIPPNAPIEGVGDPNSTGDRHVLVVDRDNCVLYETDYSFPQGGGTSWTAFSGAVFDLRSNALRPETWTSADAAGLPIFPGLARYDEVAAGTIEHALRFTASSTQRAYVWPARHYASSITDLNFPPMGARFRLKASVNINGLSAQPKVIAQAMKTYGIILADNGSSWFVSGAPDERWDNPALAQLNVLLKGSDFEAVDVSSLLVDPNSGQAVQPVVTVNITQSGGGAGVVTSAPAGLNCGATCTASFNAGASLTLSATASGGSVFTGWSGGGCSAAAPCTIAPTAATTVNAAFALLAGTPTAQASPASLDFGAQSMQTTTPAFTLSVINAGTGPLTINTVSVSNAQFAQTNACTTLATGANCTVTLTFTPTVQGAVTGNLVVATSAGPLTVPLTGVGERSLVIHYYQGILNRAPDAAGKAFWEGEATRMAGLGADLREAYYVMAGYFFNSPEYQSFGKNDTQFVTDLYNTFFNRPPDSGGLTYWLGQISGGLPREVVLFSFMFSPEFQSFTTGIFGNTAARPEVNMVMDFFRGVLNRLPDTAAYNFWVGQLKTAQCAGAGAVYAKVNEISYAFILGPEYLGRSRTNTQFVTDMYYSFLRRGGDTAGVLFWVNQLNTAAKDRNTERADFIASPEFGARVNAVIAAGCVP